MNNKAVRLAELHDDDAPLDYEYPDPYAPRPDASKRVAALHRAVQVGRPTHDTEPIAPLARPARRYLPFAIGAALIVLIIGAASYQLSRLPSAQPLAITPATTMTAPTATESDVAVFTAPSSTPVLAPKPTRIPTPTAPLMAGQGLTLYTTDNNAVATSTPEPPAPEPSYVEIVGQQAPHCVRTCDGKPGPNGGDWAPVPTVAPAMLEVIGNQAPHKVR